MSILERASLCERVIILLLVCWGSIVATHLLLWGWSYVMDCLERLARRRRAR